MQGNSLSMIAYDARGGVTGLIPVPWLWVILQVVVVGGESRLVFDIATRNAETVLLGIPTRIPASEALHIKARSDNGILGKSVLARAPAVLEAAHGVQEFSTSVWRHGANPSMAVSVPAGLDLEAKRRMIQTWEARVAGASNTGRILWADADTKVTSLTMNSTDAEVLASRRLSVEDISRLFMIPAPMLQTGATAPATLTPYLSAFARLAMAPLVTAIEAEWDDLLPAGQHLQIDLGGYMRGDYSAIAASQAVLVQSKIATPNDARRTLGMPAHPDGDELSSGSAPNYPADAAGVPSLAPKPGPGAGAPDAIPNIGTNQNEGAS
jgi:HK97 family phage portal protein